MCKILDRAERANFLDHSARVSSASLGLVLGLSTATGQVAYAVSMTSFLAGDLEIAIIVTIPHFHC
jgi:hypothetical protein